MRRLHVWDLVGGQAIDRDKCRRCGAFRWFIRRPSGGSQHLYGRDLINWSVARPECAPPARGVSALIPEAGA